MNDLDLCLEVVQCHVNHCGLGHVTLQLLTSDRTSSKLLEIVTSNLLRPFVIPFLFDYRVLHCITIVYCEAVRSAIPATAWLLVNNNDNNNNTSTGPVPTNEGTYILTY